jgi:hypothetical protein
MTMKIDNKFKSLFLIVAVLVAIEPLLSTSAVAKSCNAASAQGRGGLNCGPAPVTSNSQATGQVTGTKPSQVGAPSIGTSNQNTATKPPVTTLPAALPKAPTEGPKPDPILAQPPTPPSRSPDMPLGTPVPVAGIVNVVAPPLTPQFVPPTPHPVPMVAPPMVPQQAPMVVPPLVQQSVPVAVPPMVLQQTPVAVPTLMPQKAPMVVPPLVQQSVPVAVPPMVLQQTPVAVPTLMPQKAPMLIPPAGTPQQAPMAVPPMAPKQTPVLVPVPIKMNVPPKVTAAVTTPVQVPSANLPVVANGSAPRADGYVTPRPKPVSSSSSTKATGSSVLASTSAQPALVITSDAKTAIRNEKMITVEPGRQAANNYPTFNVNSATPNRVCVVSGLERRKTVESNGSATYQGTLPTFRMVATELADLPAWHPIDSGCVVSITHKR